MIDLPEDRRIVSARCLIAADDSGSLFVNGHSCGSGYHFGATRIADVKAHLRPGKNVLAVQVENGGEDANPAGVMGKLVVKYADDETESFPVDKSWVAADKEIEGLEDGNGDAGGIQTG